VELRRASNGAAACDEGAARSAVALAGVRDAQARDTERGAPRCEGWVSGWGGVEWSGAGAERRGAERARARADGAGGPPELAQRAPPAPAPARAADQHA
jgi:hypothetical protein